MTETFHKLLLSELHMVVCQPGDNSALTDRLLCEAVTVNENLRSLGFTLKPADLVRLAVSPDLHGFYPALRDRMPSVQAEPMYPGFPKQVMQMPQAQFRLHQFIHYFSTYGLELLTGQAVSRGWLPEYSGPARTREDTLLLDAAVLELVAPEDAPRTALQILLGRREQLTEPELILVPEAAALCPPEQMTDLTVRFKRNLELLFPLLMETAPRETALAALRAICAHSGDVLRCCADYLTRKKYHLRTSEKKLLVKLLERYPVRDLQQNLMQSNRNRERNLKVLQHLDYNRYSRSPEHREAVRALRNGDLLSWHGIGEQLLEARSPEAPAHFAQRPGYMVRMLNRLLSLDYTPQQILSVLLPQAHGVSAHLCLNTIQTLSLRKERLEAEYLRTVRDRVRSYDRAIADCDPGHLAREYRCRENMVRQAAQQDRSWAAGYRLSTQIGQAHTEADTMVHKPLAALFRQQEKIAGLRRILDKQAAYQPDGKPILIRNAHSDFDPDLVYFHCLPDVLAHAVAEAEAELKVLETRLEQARQESRLWLEQKIQTLLQQDPQAAGQLEQINGQERLQLALLDRQYLQDLESAEERRAALLVAKQTELERLEQCHQAQQKWYTRDQGVVSILTEVLKAHYLQADTPLKGRKVFFRMEGFDLSHSVVEAHDRSAEGGYIPSGISYSIPQDARYVRFFIYWNDPQRVDIDLHVAGRAEDGSTVHVGWNGDFRNYGVTYSGDITHSDAAEYIDIDLSAPMQQIYANVDLFSGKPCFRDVQTCYVGMMAVDRIGADVKHYNPANCFFTHELRQQTDGLYYGYVDVRSRFVRFVGQPCSYTQSERFHTLQPGEMLSLQDYLNLVLEAQGATPVPSAEEADVVLTMGKSTLEKGVSLVDHNFFLEC